MNKLKFSIAALLCAGFILSSCIEHEVIPAPTPTVELKCSFDGIVNGTDVHLMQFIDGYDCTPTKAKYLLPPPQWSTAVYYSEIASASSPVSFKIGMGSVAWDASTTGDPTLALFNDFFTSNLTPNFSNVGVSGIEVSYRDAAGRNWVSHDNSVNVQNASFTSISQESDETGDYSKFICNFNCYVYYQDPGTMLWDSIQIQNAAFKGWFKR